MRNCVLRLLLCFLTIFGLQASALAQSKHLFEIGLADIRCVVMIGPAAPEVRAQVYILGDALNFLMARSGAATEHQATEIPGPFRFFAVDMTDEKHLEWLGWFDEIEPTVIGGLIKKRFLIRLTIDGVEDNLAPMFGLTTGDSPLDGYLMFSISDVDYNRFIAVRPVCEHPNRLVVERYKDELERLNADGRRFVEKFRQDQQDAR